jgi:hypothetical protein
MYAQLYYERCTPGLAKFVVLMVWAVDFVNSQKHHVSPSQYKQGNQDVGDSAPRQSEIWMELPKTPPQNPMSNVWHIRIVWHYQTYHTNYCKPSVGILVQQSEHTFSVCRPVLGFNVPLFWTAQQLHVENLALCNFSYIESLYSWWKAVYGFIYRTPMPNFPSQHTVHFASWAFPVVDAQ